MSSKDWAASPTSLAISVTAFSHTLTASPPPPPPFDNSFGLLATFKSRDSSDVFMLEFADSFSSVAVVGSLGSGNLNFSSDNWGRIQ